MNEPMLTTLVVAVSRDGVIGLTDSGGVGRLPWHIKSDLRHFKAVTSASNPADARAKPVVIMGRRTFESLAAEGCPHGLPGRINIVVSGHFDAKAAAHPSGPRLLSCSSLRHALDAACEQFSSSPIFIAGGASIYRDALAQRLVDRIEITDVQAEIGPLQPPGTHITHFPAEPMWSHDPSRRAKLGWRLIGERYAPENSQHGDQYACWFRTYERDRL